MTKARKGKLTDRELIQLAQKAEAAKAKVAAAKKAEEDLKRQVIEEMQTRGTRAIEHGGVRVTLVQAERVHYDEPSLFGLLSHSQRRAVFVEALDLNALPDATRKKLIAAVPKSQRADATTRSLDVQALSQAVQTGIIDPEVASSVSEVVPSAPYFRLSGAS